jgi:hypothetical protein
MSINELFDVPAETEEQPEPEICPCTVVKNFRCPARIKGKLLKRCVGADNYTRCGNFASWFWYKVAQVKAKEIEVPE